MCAAAGGEDRQPSPGRGFTARADIGTEGGRTDSSVGRFASKLTWVVCCGAGPIGDYLVAPALPAARRGTVFTARDFEITRTTQLGFSASAAGIACFRWRSAGQLHGRTGYISKDKILQPFGLVAGLPLTIVEVGEKAAAKAVGASAP